MTSHFWNWIVDILYILYKGSRFYNATSLEKLKKTTPRCHLADKLSTKKDSSHIYSINLTLLQPILTTNQSTLSTKSGNEPQVSQLLSTSAGLCAQTLAGHHTVSSSPTTRTTFRGRQMIKNQ